MTNIKSAVVASFERNGKTYVILEFETSQLTRNIEPLWPDFPDWGDFNVSATFQNGQVCITITYDDKKWEQCITVMPDCYEPGDIDLFSVGPAKIYVRYLSVCPTRNGARVSLQVWAKIGPIKTKLGEFSKDLP
jgi:hypothetical protein